MNILQPLKIMFKGNSLAVQWLGLHTFTAMARVQLLVRKQIPQAPQHGQKKKERKKEMFKDTNLKRYMHLYVHCSIVYNSQDMETTSVPVNG